MVYNAVEEYIQEKQKLCSVKDISEIVNISTTKTRDILNYLVEFDKLSIAYKKPSETTIYITKYMYDEILQLQHKPKWLNKYSFKSKSQKLKDIEKLRKEINEFEIIERLLYGSGEPLEESVTFCLKQLGFENVTHHKNKGEHDISFIFEDKTYLLELEGTKRQGTKKKILQLRGWIDTAIDNDFDLDKIKGIYVINPYKNIDPSKREDPLTKHAKRYLKQYGYKFFTTVFLFNTIKEVLESKIKKEEAILKILKGEDINYGKR